MSTQQRKRCPNCQSLHTKKQGSYFIKTSAYWGKRQRKIQRYYCFNCQSTFSKRAEPKGYEPMLVLKAADLYFKRIYYF
jgi:transposase-like protein